MGHGHSHGGDEAALVSLYSPSYRRKLQLILGGITLALILATLVGMFALWPSASKQPEKSALLAPGARMYTAQVVEVPAQPPVNEFVPVQAVGQNGEIAGEKIAVSVPPEVFHNGIHVGSKMKIMQLPKDVTGADENSGGYAYFDLVREVPITILTLIYLAVVALVARGRGLRAVLGLGASVMVVIVFLLPALTGGENPILVGLVGASAMMVPAVYLAHGISIRTTTALWGTLAGMGLTLLLAFGFAGPTGMTGAGDEAAVTMFTSMPQVSLSALFVAGVLISGLGALNDVTITQASSVWELRAAMPQASRAKVFTAAMRIGRDHIASTVYTLAFAYIGTALPVLLLASNIDRSLLETLMAGDIAEEIFRTLLASIGLVLAIPLTTAIAALLAGGAEPKAPETPKRIKASEYYRQEEAGEKTKATATGYSADAAAAKAENVTPGDRPRGRRARRV